MSYTKIIKVKNAFFIYGRLHKKELGYVYAYSAILLAFIISVLLYAPRTIAFSLSEDNCFYDISIFPKSEYNQNSHFLVSHQPKKIFGAEAISFTTCLSADKAFEPKEVVIIQRKSDWLLPRSIKVVTPDFPRVAGVAALSKVAIPVKKDLKLELSSHDDVSNYQLYFGEDNKASCTSENYILICKIEEAKLKHAEVYEMNVRRTIGRSKPTILVTQEIKTLDPLLLNEKSFAPDGVVYDKPLEFSLTFNKKLNPAQKGTYSLISGDNKVPINAVIEDSRIKLILDQELERSADYTLNVADIESQDFSQLNEPIAIAFRTSGGPQIVSNNLLKSKFSRSSAITIGFDVELEAVEATRTNISLLVNGAANTFNLVKNGTSINLIPSATLPACAFIEVKIASAIKSVHGVSGTELIAISGRTLCQQVERIGTSVNGRSITAYTFGNGANRYVFVGAMHGNELSAKYTLTSFINDLENNPGLLPANRTVTIIPSLNPDGAASYGRYNANNVDLNRNFPANNWQADVRVYDGSVVQNNGGTQPLSEPESKAIADFINARGARAVLSHHAVGSLVDANGVGNSSILANTYAQLTGYYVTSGGSNEDLFGYQITGTFEGWLRDKKGIPTLVIEHSSRTSNEYNKHRSALLKMITF